MVFRNVRNSCLETEETSSPMFSIRSSIVCMCVCVSGLFLWTSSFKLRRYSNIAGFVEAADCKTAASYSFNKTVTKGLCAVFPCDQVFLLSLLTLSNVKYDMIICMLNLSEIILSENKWTWMLLARGSQQSSRVLGFRTRCDVLCISILTVVQVSPYRCVTRNNMKKFIFHL